MFDFLKRNKLVKRGLASRKTRRRRSTNELLRSLEYATLHQVADLRGLYRRACLSDLQRTAAGADEEFRHRASLFRYGADSALD